MKKITTQATITSFTNPKNENSIIQSVLLFISYADNLCFSHENMDHIEAALSEAVNNAFTFAYPNKQGKVSVCISIYDNKIIKLKVKDYGCGIEDIDKARKDFFTTKEKHSGMGFAIMQAYSSKFDVKSTLGKGTIVTMEFKL